MNREQVEKVEQLKLVEKYLNEVVRKGLLDEMDKLWKKVENSDEFLFERRNQTIQMKLDVNYKLLEDVRTAIQNIEGQQ